MQISAEMRWFWPKEAPDNLVDWFRKESASACAAGGGGIRVDRYLRDTSQCELGIKERGRHEGKPDGVEIKGLVGPVVNELSVAPFFGQIEIWTKWTSKVIELQADCVIAVTKQRWLRKFDTGSPVKEIALEEDEKPKDGVWPKRGCNVELTFITLSDGTSWWTLGLEAFGQLDTVECDLRTVAVTLALRRPPNLTTGQLASYPVWLNRLSI